MVKVGGVYSSIRFEVNSGRAHYPQEAVHTHVMLSGRLLKIRDFRLSLPVLAAPIFSGAGHRCNLKLVGSNQEIK
jgi:hypothetical protein